MSEESEYNQPYRGHIVHSGGLSVNAPLLNGGIRVMTPL